MFEWLDEEISQINTRRFHVVDGPASAKLREAVERCTFPLPPSYREFVLRYGNAKLYRRGNNWLIHIDAGPKVVKNGQSEHLIQFGRTDSSIAYFKESLLQEDRECPVFEWRYEEEVERSTDSFEAWLFRKAKAARTRYRKSEWTAIEKGPPPFTTHEKAIIEARRQFSWRVVGLSNDDNVLFEVHNGSPIMLRYLSIGIRGPLRPPKSGPLTGGVYLPVASISPGETKVIEFDCYKKFIVPERTEAFDLEDPGPEDRDQYWEFRT